MVFFATRGLLGPSGTNAGDIDVGTEVILSENGQPVNYLIVNQGIPENSPLYDASCEGTWLLRKDIAENRAWNEEFENDYKNSTINAYLNGDWLNRYDPAVLEAIVQAKIPYVNGLGSTGPVAYGTNGLSVRCFLLSSKEFGFTESYIKNDGVELNLFKDPVNYTVIANLNGSPSNYWTRTPASNGGGSSCLVSQGGVSSYASSHNTNFGVRSSIILPYEFKLKLS